MTQVNPMTPAERAEIAARAEAATPGPWEYCRLIGEEGLPMKPDAAKKYVAETIDMSGGEEFFFVSGDSKDVCHTGNGPTSAHNGDFIAHARTDIPALLAEVKRLAEKCDDLRGEIDDHDTDVASASECASGLLRIASALGLDRNTDEKFDEAVFTDPDDCDDADLNKHPFKVPEFARYVSEKIKALAAENERLRDAERIAWAKMHMGWDIEMGHPPEGFRYYLTHKVKGIAVLIGPDYWHWSDEARAAIDAAKETP